MARHTVLSDFSRQVREEPLFYIYDHKFFLIHQDANVEEVSAWLQKRYVEAKSGNRYRICTYKHSDGSRYVDYLLLESVSDADLMYIKLRWGWSKDPVKRNGKVNRKRLTPEQRKRLDALIENVRDQFYASM